MNLIQDTHQELKGFTILVVEDNELNQMVAKGLLEYNGASVAIANHGKEALEILRNETIDCVLMDIQMPVMDGLEATRRIVARGPGRPRIVAMTANAMAGDREACIAAGMDDYVTKPIRVDVLVEALMQVTPRSAA